MDMNPVRWFEIYVQDMDRAKAFYETVLDTTLEQLPGPDLAMLAFPQNPQVSGSTGALLQVPGVPSGGNSTLVYFACEDCAVEAERVNTAGGSLEREKMSIGEYGFVALAKDPDGNMIGLHSNN
ncbi:MAG: VOC family protein [Gammaproteobacteria bacterium]|jgi:hypothetical protein|nr:VOC family protein [Gammaproteobacteria bacterium]MDP6537299.1 VOC family protein [Gammaproteobacteria bacterium]MDP6731687.1 VOC family protein [Gammaproteobacteria bacterium]|tara:strand:+ start:505 stop:876 length:372 start_codon:yes stop_codon:yes gene_type:complete